MHIVNSQTTLMSASDANSSSTPANATTTTTTSSSSLLNRPIIMELIQARNVVKADLMSESDPYVVASIRESDKVTSKLAPNSIEYKWPTVDDEPNPYWGTTVWLAKEAKQGHFLHLRLYDEDTSKDDLLGALAIPVDRLFTGKVIGIKIPYSGDRSKIQEIDVRFREFPPMAKKKVIIIRHGESEWNNAQSKHNIRQMISRVDHPLTNAGAGQALRLAEKVKKAKENKESQSQEVKDLLETEIVYVSPLCRAVQTALLCLYPLGTQPSWDLKKNAREKRNFGGRDSSGTCFGKDILPFYVKELLALGDNYNDALRLASSPGTSKEEPPGGKIEKNATNSANLLPFPSPEPLAQLLEKLNKREADSKWWTDDREDRDDSSRRISDLFFQQVMWDPRPVIVIVGHSHFFRDTFVNYMSEKLREKIKGKQSGYADYTLDQWFHYKLENCGAAHVEFDFSKIISRWDSGKPATGDDLKCIEEVKLIFDTKLIA